jgi:hypothetical protein
MAVVGSSWWWFRWEVRGAKITIFVRRSQQDRAKRGQTLEHKRARALFVHKTPGTLVSTFSELPAFTQDIVSVSKLAYLTITIQGKHIVSWQIRM